MNTEQINEEVPKYKKKKQSSTSRSTNKSKHKHQYKEVLFVKENRPHRGKYCTICGKIGHMNFFETEPTEQMYYRVLDSDEVYEKYKHLEQKRIEDVFQKFVSVEVEA